MKFFTTYNSALEVYVNSVPEEKIKELIKEANKENIFVIAGRIPQNYPKEIDYSSYDTVRSRWHKVKVRMNMGERFNIFFTSQRLDAEEVKSLGLEPIKKQEDKEVKFKMLSKLKESK